MHGLRELHQDRGVAQFRENARNPELFRFFLQLVESSLLVDTQMDTVDNEEGTAERLLEQGRVVIDAPDNPDADIGIARGKADLALGFETDAETARRHRGNAVGLFIAGVEEERVQV